MVKQSSTGSKASLIRDYVQANPGATGADVVLHFKGQKIAVATSEVSNARKALGLVKRRKGRRVAEETMRPRRETSLVERVVNLCRDAGIGAVRRELERIAAIKKIPA